MKGGKLKEEGSGLGEDERKRRRRLRRWLLCLRSERRDFKETGPSCCTL